MYSISAHISSGINNILTYKKCFVLDIGSQFLTQVIYQKWTQQKIVLEQLFPVQFVWYSITFLVAFETHISGWDLLSKVDIDIDIIILIFESNNSYVSQLVLRLRHDSKIIQDAKPKVLKGKNRENKKSDIKYVQCISYNLISVLPVNIFSKVFFVKKVCSPWF